MPTLLCNSVEALQRRLCLCVQWAVTTQPWDASPHPLSDLIAFPQHVISAIGLSQTGSRATQKRIVCGTIDRLPKGDLAAGRRKEPPFRPFSTFSTTRLSDRNKRYSGRREPVFSAYKLTAGLRSDAAIKQARKELDAAATNMDIAA